MSTAAQNGAGARGGDSIFSMIRLGLILAVYAVAACTVLALIHNVTAPVIAAQAEAKAQEAMRAVFAQAEEFAAPAGGAEAFAPGGSATLDALMLAKAGGKVIGAVAQVTGPTYDHSTIMVGMALDGTITGMQYLENTDTPGFGQKGSDPTFTLAGGTTFYGQFAGKNAADGFVAGQTFDAISGATITSNGIGALMTGAAAAMTRALEAYK